MPPFISSIVPFLLILALCGSPIWAQPALVLPEVIEQTRAICIQAKNGDLKSDEIADLFSRPGTDLSITHNLPGRFDAVLTMDANRAAISIRQPGAAGQRTRLRFDAIPGHKATEPAYFIMMGQDCKIETVRLVRFDDHGRPIDLTHFSGDPLVQESQEPLNPPVPAGSDPGGVAIAHIDAGVNYLLPTIANRLARDQEGQIYGRDLTDHDRRPFDLDPTGSPLLPRRHGTSVASLMLQEAPRSRLVPIRHPGADSKAIGEIVDIIASTPARIVAMPLGSKTMDDWTAFAAAAARHPDILFIISAGNNGRDIDTDPIFPASFDNDNFLVVTSVDHFGKLPRESNWGSITVDIAVPAELIEVTDHRGATVRASGTSYAVPRVAALAARISAANPAWKAAEIKSLIIDFAIVMIRRGKGKTRYGWLPNPAAVGPDAPN